ncbi:vacuolar iron transporter homolog 2-like [Oryza brachyantha]|uniref:vacuolar iron transporter homolog 2-like n=1 Tax=Oryza brachyantha TaxID=4533 RepID=UPI001ADA8397|nr:vacuolar iron transporter homolog 2-like [Oryza brachyantha]
MDPHLSSHVHAAAAGAAPNCTCMLAKEEDLASVVVDVEAAPHYSSLKTAEGDLVPRGGGGGDGEGDEVNYMARAQWLRAAVLGANDGLVSVASLMIGVGAVNTTAKAMLVSGLAGLVAGACSMAIGEFVSVYAQYDIEVSQIERDGDNADAAAKEKLPSPTLAAFASALAFAVGGLLPLLAGGFIKPWGARVGVVCAASSVGLAGFGAAGAYLGGANMVKSGTRVLLGGWLAMLVTYAVLRLFGTVFHMDISSSG